MAELPELDPVVHGKLRLAVLSLLATVDAADFVWLRERTGASDGNLGAQLAKLEAAGYIAMEREFRHRKPRTQCRLTKKGRRALAGYVKALRRLLGAAMAESGEVAGRD